MSSYKMQPHQQHPASRNGMQPPQHIYQGDLHPLLLDQRLQGTAVAAGKTMLQQQYTQQPFYQQQKGLHPPICVQTSPALLHQQVSLHANSSFTSQQHMLSHFNLLQPAQQQSHMRYPCTQRQDPQYLAYAYQRQSTLRQNSLHEPLQLQQLGGWPVAKKDRPPGDPLIRLTVTVLKYRCRHAASRNPQGHALDKREDVSSAGENGRDSAGNSVNGCDNSSSSTIGVNNSSLVGSSTGSSSSNNATGSSKDASAASDSVTSSMLFFAGKRLGKGTNKKNEEAGSTALQSFTVTYSAAVHRSLLESLPLFGCMHNAFFGTPQRVVLLAFEQEDHVSADVIWRLLDFCRLSQMRAAKVAVAPEPAASAEDADCHGGPDATGHTSSMPPATAGIATAAVNFVARMSVEQLLLAYAGCLMLLNQLHCMQQQNVSDGVEGQSLLGTRAKSQAFMHAQQRLLHHPQQQHFCGSLPSQQHFFQPQEQQQQAQQVLLNLQQQQQHLTHQAQQQNGNISHGQEWQRADGVGHCSTSTASDGSFYNEQEAETAAKQHQLTPVLILQHVRDAGASKIERLLDEALLPLCCCIAYRYDDLRLLESCYWLLRHILLEKGLPSEWKEQPQQSQQQVVVIGAAEGVSAAPTSGAGGEEKQEGTTVSTQQQQQRRIENTSASAVALRREQQPVQREQQQQIHQETPFLTQQRVGLQQQQQVYCSQLPSLPSQQQQLYTSPLATQPSVYPATGTEQSDTNTKENPQERETDDSWMPPSVFAACTGRKACFSVPEATLKYLSHTVPLAAFWRVVAEEVCRKSAFLAEPRGYLHCEIRRLRTPSGSSFVYPHVYLLFADAASCRQLGLQQQLAVQQQQQQTPQSQGQSSGGEQKKKSALTQQHQDGRVMLLFGRKQSEYATVEFFLPSVTLLEAASRCCCASEGEGGVAEKAVVPYAQQVLTAAASAEMYGKDYLGSLHAGFWGTRFSLRHWGMKQPCKIRGGEALPSPLALALPADAPFSAAAVAASTSISAPETVDVSRESAAAAARKIIYTRVVKVYKEETEECTTMYSPSLAAVAAAQQQSQRHQCPQQQQHHDHAWKGQRHQEHACQQQYEYVWQQEQQHEYFSQQHQGDDYLHRQQEIQQLIEQTHKPQHEQQQEHPEMAAALTGKDEEVSDVSLGQQADPCACKQHDQQNNEEESPRMKNGLPFFLSCSRSHDEILPAVGEVAEVCSAIPEEKGQSQTSAHSGGGSDINGKKRDQHREAAGPTASAAGAATKGNSSTQEEVRPIHVVPHQQETELCTIEFETNLRGDMPRQMSVKLLRESGSYNLESVKPRWDESIRAYSLPFFGRAKVPSAKNVQLTPSRAESGRRRKRSSSNSKSRRVGVNRRETAHGDPDGPVATTADEDDDGNEDEESNTSIYLMMGKLSKDVFALDFRAPVRIFEAFAIAAATLAKKRAVS